MSLPSNHRAVALGLSPAVWALVSLTAGALVCLGARDPVSRLLVTGIIGATATGHLLASRRLLRVLPATPAFLAGTFGLAGVAVIQLAASAFVEPWIAPSGAATFGAVEMLSYTVFFLLAVEGTQRSGASAALMSLLATIGLLEAAYGVGNLLAGNTHLLYFSRPDYLTSATGTLVSRNHFAYLMELTIPLAAAKALDPAGQGSNLPAAERQARRAMAGTGVAIMLFALVLSQSRMGLISLIASTSTILAVNRFLRPQDASALPGFRTGFWISLVLATLLAAVGLDVAFERFASTTRDLEVGRIPVWLESLRVGMSKPIIGHGFGTFTSIASAFRDGPTGLSFDHAHNDYIELFAESGVAGLAVATLWLACFVRRTGLTLARPLAPAQRLHVLAVAIALLSIVMHSSVDFGLRIPGVALTTLLLVALFLRLTQDQTRYA